MPATPDAQTDSAAAVADAIQPKSPWRVAWVQPLADYRLKVRFMDGLEGEVHMADLLTSSDAGVFALLRDRRLFDEAYIHWGAVTWPGDLDLAPDAMYDEIKAKGVCRVGPVGSS